VRVLTAPRVDSGRCDTGIVNDEYHPELAEYEPHGDKPLRSRRMTLFMRGVVIVTLVALILPGILTAGTFAEATAKRVCNIWAAYEIKEQYRTAVRFEWFAHDDIAGWECYAITATGEQHVKSLGLIPEAPQLPDGTFIPA